MRQIFLTLYFQKHSDFEQVSIVVQRTWGKKKTPPAQFIRSEVPSVTNPRISVFTFIQDNISHLKNMKLLAINSYLPPLF